MVVKTKLKLLFNQLKGYLIILLSLMPFLWLSLNSF